MVQPTFAERIRERYPEGLTGIFAVGGTRMTYALARQRHHSDPGHIESIDAYAAFVFECLQNLITWFLDFGGQNIIIPVASYQLLYDERGPKYIQTAVEISQKLADGEWVEFYKAHHIDPYFAGIDTLLHLPNQTLTYDLAVKCSEFNKTWSYNDSHHKLIWEVAPIPLFSLWNSSNIIDKQHWAQLESQLAEVSNLQDMHDLLYRFYGHAVYGTDIPMPHFYVGHNRNGDLKLRALLPIALLCGGPFRMFYTPYPSLFMTRETLQAILENLAFGKPLTTKQSDYGGQLTSELVESEYQRIMELSANPLSTLGLIRQAQSDYED